MYCNHCGTRLADSAKFCSSCGRATATGSQPIYTSTPLDSEPTIEEIQRRSPAFTFDSYDTQPELTPAQIEEKNSLATSTLVWGILGLSMTCSVYFSFLGIIFSCIAKSKAKKYHNKYNERRTKVTVGRNLAKAGFIAGIILTAFIALIIFSEIMTAYGV